MKGPSARLILALMVAAGATGVVATPASSSPAPQPIRRIIFSAPRGSSVLVHGTYRASHPECADPAMPPLHERYAGEVEVGRDSRGDLFVIGALPLEEYLKGIAEVPLTWPMEALKAQAVAARTYALARLGVDDPTGDELGYQLCATAACQVYRGLGVSKGPHGARWARAVRDTAGQILVHGGRPADTLYFSTSNGRTHGNEEIFGSAPLPYLRPVPERDDRASPTSRWRTVMPLDDMALFLRSAGEWPPGAPLSTVRRIGDHVALGGGGVSRTLEATDFRIALNTWSRCLAPERYPTLNSHPRSPGSGTRLAQTVPSRWFQVVGRPGSAVIIGRGWGHGVGMVQWGARGKADRGMSYRQILSYYYGGLAPQRVKRPGVIRIGVATGLASVRVQATGPVSVEPGQIGPGSWFITGGRGLSIRAKSRPPRPRISAGRLVAPARARSGQRVKATLTVPQTSVVRLRLRSEGKTLTTGRPATVPAGAAQVSLQVPPVVSGSYSLQAVVTDGTDIILSRPAGVTITGVRPATPAPSAPPTTSDVPVGVAQPEERDAPAWPIGLVSLIAGVTLLLLGGIFLLRRAFR